MLLIIDNYDSFTFNLVHYFRELGQDVLVFRNDEITIAEIAKLKPDYLVISPGPCDPDNAGISLQAVKEFAHCIPILGVCLGHQCIAQAFGAKIEKAEKVMHGKTSAIVHDADGLFKQLKLPLTVTRYHSLIVNKAYLPEELIVTAHSVDNENNIHEIMALKHAHLPVASVQFHPESILTKQGHDLLRNFLNEYRNY